jgi:hypothetical protein
MKKIQLLLITLFLASSNYAQNIQLHYDFGQDKSIDYKRHYLTATLEQFHPDTCGSWFYFVDFDFDSPNSNNAMSTAYWEISREFYIPGLHRIKGFEPLTLHVEYNDGITIFQANDTLVSGLNLDPTALCGLSYGWGYGNLYIQAMVLYKYYFAMENESNVQFTVVWNYTFLKNRITFDGYFDLWTQDDFNNPKSRMTAFQSEPQIWFNFTPHISAGSELEISRNFIYGSNKWEFFPTVAGKWTF